MRMAVAVLAISFFVTAQAQAATRFYMARHERYAANPVSADAGWEDASEMYLARLTLGSNMSSGRWGSSTNQSLVGYTTLTPSSTNQDAQSQIVSPHLAAGVEFVSGVTTVWSEMPATESTSTSDVTMCITGLRVVNSAYAVQATLLSVAHRGTALEFVANGAAIGLDKRVCINSGTTVTANYTTSAGDMLVYEVGCQNDGATGTPSTCSIGVTHNNSYDNANAFRDDCDLETTTSECNPFIEFSNTITLLADSGPTRLYFPSSTAAAVSPTASAEWVDTSEIERRRLEHSSGGSTAMGTGQQVDVTEAVYNSWNLDRQYVSDEMPAGIVFTAEKTTVQMSILSRQVDNSGGYGPAVGVRIVSSDGSTVRATLLYVNTHAAGGAFPSLDTTTLAIRGPIGPRNVVENSYTTVSGDRLLVETGCKIRGTDASMWCQMRYGETASDCGTTEDSSTDCSPWIEFGNAITFGSGYLPRPSWFGHAAAAGGK